jgi:hypothetical protein
VPGNCGAAHHHSRPRHWSDDHDRRRKQDHKIIAIVTEDPEFNSYHEAAEMPPHRLLMLRRFFQDYKQLEGNAVEVDEWTCDSTSNVLASSDHGQSCRKKKKRPGIFEPGLILFRRFYLGVLGTLLTTRGKRSPRPWAVQLCSPKPSGTPACSAPPRRPGICPASGDR